MSLNGKQQQEVNSLWSRFQLPEPLDEPGAPPPIQEEILDYMQHKLSAEKALEVEDKLIRFRNWREAIGLALLQKHKDSE